MQMHIHNLHQLIIKHPVATFFWRCAGDGMTHAGIFDGDILVIDRAVEVQHGDVVVASHAGGYVVRRYLVEEGQAWLYKDMCGEEDLAPIANFIIWGCVICSIHNPNARATRAEL